MNRTKVAKLNSEQWPLWVILALFSALTVYQSLVLPLGEADDETDHYQYHQFVARAGRPPLTPAEREAAGFKGGLAPLYYWLTAWPVAWVGPDTPPQLRRVDSRPERHIPTDGLGINHVLHTLDETWPWRGQPLAWHGVRLLSLPMAWVTIIVTFLLARRLFPARRRAAFLAAGFVAFLPRFVISSAVINDDNLVFALIALLLLVQVTILQKEEPPTAAQMALFGGLFGLALVTKYFTLILLPEIFLTLFFIYRKRKTPHLPTSPSPWLPFFATLFLTAGLWFIFIVARFNRVAELGLIPGLAASLGEPQITEGLVGLLSRQSVRPVAATYSLPAWLGLLYRSFWLEYGWMNIFAPDWMYVLFGLFSVAALAGFIRTIAGRANPRKLNTVHGLLILHAALFGVVVLARFILSATVDTGQGRHLYPALPVIALFVAAGIGNLQFTIGRWRLPGMSALIFTAAFFIPAMISLLPQFSVHNSQFTITHLSRTISPHYHTHPVTTEPPILPPAQRLEREFAPGLWLAGFAAPSTAVAGNTLPVTLYWRAEQEAAQDYALELCLLDSGGVPAGCRRGHFEDGRYPPRAWETGDTLADTVHIPVAPCGELSPGPAQLRLTVFEVNPVTPDLQPGQSVLTAALPANIELQSAAAPSPGPEWWLGQTRLTEPTEIGLNQTVTQIGGSAPRFKSDSGAVWTPLPGSPQPCAASFVAGPALPPGEYRQPGAPPLSLPHRSRALAPLTSTLTFSRTLAPLSLSAGGQTVDLSAGLPPVPPRLTVTGGQLPVSVRWQARRWMADPLVIALKLVDKDFVVGGQRIATLGDRYPNVLWIPTEIVEETYPLQILPDAPTGLYRLEMGVIKEDDRLPGGYQTLPPELGGEAAGENLYPLVVRLPDPARNSPPANPFNGQLGDTIRLTGFEVNPPTPDSPDTVELALYWQSTQKIPADYTVFTQLIGPDGQVWAQWDNPPQAGRYPTSAWEAADRVVDRYTLALRPGAPPGEYRLLVGMYTPANGRRLPATLDGAPQPDNALLVATVQVNP